MAKEHHQFVWVWFIVTVGLGFASFFLFTRNASTPVPASWGVDGGARDGMNHWFNALQQYLLSPAIVSFLGALILIRRPSHRIGRMLVILGLLSSFCTLTQEWGVYAYFTLKTVLPGAAIAAWITNWIWVMSITLLLLTTAVFPDGRFLSSGWGRFIGSLLFLLAVSLLAGAMVETPMSSMFQLANPFVANHPEAFYNLVFVVGVATLPVTAMAVLASTIMRFRKSQARERQQMKWLLFGVAVMVFLTVVGLGIYFGIGNNVGAIMVNAAIIGPALGVGIALLRHQLYDIDILIRRTLIYSIITATLVFFYFGSVILLQQIFRSLTGAGDDLAIIVSTLVLAALFNPLRRRVQDTIDRRFFRRRYDAHKVLERFAVTARDEVELEKLTDELLNVVNETMQPTSVSLWLKRENKETTRS